MYHPECVCTLVSPILIYGWMDVKSALVCTAETPVKGHFGYCTLSLFRRVRYEKVHALY